MAVVIHKPQATFKRILKDGVDPGKDVKAIKRAGSRFGVWPWQQFDDVWHTGPKTFSNVAIPALRKKFKMPSGKNYDEELHRHLLVAKVPRGANHPHAGEWCWDQTSLNLYNGYVDMSLAEGIVRDYFVYWHEMEKYRDRWHYSMRRPNDYTHDPEEGGYADCSGTVMKAAKAVGMKCPDIVFGYNGWGNTDSLRRGGFSISLSDVGRYCHDHLVLAFYGPNWDDTDHVIAAERADLWHSDGREAAPETWPDIHFDSFLNFLGCRAYAAI